MAALFDWLLIILSTMILINSYKRIVFTKNTSIANYIIAIIYVFCVLPIFLNYIIGIPKYNTVYWYQPFIQPMKNEKISIIYDLYIFSCIISLYFIHGRKKMPTEINNNNTLTSLFRNNKIISLILICLPVILIIATGTWKNYIIFGVASNRGFSKDTNISLMTPFLLVSMITFFSVIFKEKINWKKFLLCIVYSIIIIWISGKRFMIANILVLIIFYIVNMNLDKITRVKILKIIPILGVLLLAFSAIYLVKFRPMTETSFESVYDMLRVDFGRDDVIKYVINEEIIKNDMILEYRGQTFLSLIGAFIARKIWPSKPYPHYTYLTGSILNLSIDELPAGTTPSLLEMVICNFGKYGFIIGILILLFLCSIIDKWKDIDSKAIALLLFIVLLTQSMDVYLIAVVILFLIYISKIFFKNKSIKIIWR